MPFTFSHPAIILPFNYLPKKWFSLTGLIIGSLTPDFEYFIRMKVQSNYSHTFYGIFWFDLPLAILLSFTFHTIVRNDLYKNLPKNIQQRILVYTNFSWNTYFSGNWIVVITSILIGIVSHIFWDSFTHDSGYFVNHISLLGRSILVYGKEIPVLKIAQHLSTLIGAIIISYTILKLPKNNIKTYIVTKTYWISILIFTVIIIILRFLTGLNYNAYGHIIVSLISAFLISLILTPIFIKAKTN
ncbi:MAG: DUF4184 family protein, partial [Flavobacterium sp.]